MNSQITKKNLMQDFALYLLSGAVKSYSADEHAYCDSINRYCADVKS